MPDISIEFGVQVLEKTITAAYDFLQKEHQKRDLFGKATERYVNGLIERYSTVKVLGMNNPVALLDLYVRANILEKITARLGTRVEELEEFFDFDRRTFGKKKETQDGEAIANKFQRFIVLGKPGAGKTTFLKYLALTMVHNQSTIKKRRLPIFVTLRDWADKKASLLEYIVEQFNICGFEHAGRFVENLLRQGNCLLLFDGLDEISQETNLDDTIRDIRDFTDRYSGNQFVISCRVAAYNHWFERYKDVEMADFDENQIETFVRNWFRTEPQTGEQCLRHLKNSPQLKELSSVPLLLALLCIAYDENNNFPANRADLYEEAVEALLKKWDSSRRIHRDDPYKQLSLKQKENMFARIAYGTFSENLYFIREYELKRMIGNFIGNIPAFKTENVEVDSAEVLQTIEAHHGIFVERARNIHSFSHLTFQEYFTAKYIVEDGFLGIEKLVEDHLYDAKWKEVFLLTAGMLYSADTFFLVMQKKNRQLLSESVLNNLMVSTTKALLPTNTKYKLETRKTVFLFLSIARTLALTLDRARERTSAHDLTLARSLAHALDRACALVFDLAFDLASVLSLDRAFDLAIDLAPVRTRTLDLDLALDLALDLSFALAYNSDFALDLSLALDLDHDVASKVGNKRIVEVVEKLSSFLSGNLLIIQCLNCAAYLSKSTREHVLSQLFEPLTETERSRHD